MSNRLSVMQSANNKLALVGRDVMGISWRSVREALSGEPTDRVLHIIALLLAEGRRRSSLGLPILPWRLYIINLNITRRSLMGTPVILTSWIATMLTCHHISRLEGLGFLDHVEPLEDSAGDFSALLGYSIASPRHITSGEEMYPSGLSYCFIDMRSEDYGSLWKNSQYGEPPVIPRDDLFLWNSSIKRLTHVYLKGFSTWL